MLQAYDLLALGAAACWAFGSMLSVTPSRHLGAFAFTRWRMLMVAAVLWAVSLLGAGWHPIPAELGRTMALSGLIGIFVGDSALFSAMNRLGPRRAGVLFATHAVFSALFGILVFDEHMSLFALVGAALTMVGVMTAVMLGRHKDEKHAWEADRGGVGTGVALALFAAVCQAAGSLIAKPAMHSDIDPMVAAAIRVSVACAAHFAILWLGFPAARAHQPATLRVLAQTGLNGLVAVGLGTTLILQALKRGDVGMVSILSAVSPVLVLPLLWMHLRRPPAAGAWLGAGLTVVGTACILSR